MFSILTTNGQDVIDLADSTIDKIQITGFKVGDFAVSTPDLKLEEDGDLTDYPNLRDASYIETNFASKYDGTDLTITYVPISTDTISLKFFLPQDVAMFNFNSVLIYVTINGNESLLSLHYTLHYNPKFSTVTNRAGTKYYFMLNLKVANRDDRFDFSNLEVVPPEFDVVASIFDLPFAPYKEHDQFILEKHEQSTHVGPHVVFNSQDQFFGAPLYQIPMTGGTAPVLIPADDGQYYSHNPNEDVPVGFEYLLDEDDNQVISRLGDPIIVRSS